MAEKTVLTQTALLERLKRERQQLLAVLDGIPDEAITRPGPDHSWSGMDILAHITAWDGETLRRLAFALGESSRRPHDLEDATYWRAWNEQQIELKRLLGPRGVKVDMAGTWIRLLAQIESLSPLDYARWVEIGTGIREGHDAEHTTQLRRWREHWERSLPWWRRWRRKIFS